jgi:2C-methyl-D-erythritol 2,4-cyclodiphosphate synthase
MSDRSRRALEALTLLEEGARRSQAIPGPVSMTSPEALLSVIIDEKSDDVREMARVSASEVERLESKNRRLTVLLTQSSADQRELAELKATIESSDEAPDARRAAMREILSAVDRSSAALSNLSARIAEQLAGDGPIPF